MIRTVLAAAVTAAFFVPSFATAQVARCVADANQTCTNVQIVGASGGGGGNNVGGYEFQLSPTITVQNAAYSAGNSLGGLITATGAARTAGGSGILDSVRIRSAGGSTNTIWIYAWSKTPASTCTDKVAFAGSSTDAPYALAGFPQSVTLAAPGSFDTASIGRLTNLAESFVNKDSTPGTAIYVCLVTAGSVTPAATSDLSIILSGIQD